MGPLCSVSQAAVKMLAGLCSFWGCVPSGAVFFLELAKLTGCWQDSVLCICRTKSCFLAGCQVVGFGGGVGSI